MATYAVTVVTNKVHFYVEKCEWDMYETWVESDTWVWTMQTYAKITDLMRWDKTDKEWKAPHLWWTRHNCWTDPGSLGRAWCRRDARSTGTCPSCRSQCQTSPSQACLVMCDHEQHALVRWVKLWWIRNLFSNTAWPVFLIFDNIGHRTITNMDRESIHLLFICEDIHRREHE